MYTEATSGIPLETTRLTSPPFSSPIGSSWSLRFWYHMHGDHINKLTVVFNGNETYELLTLVGSHKRIWKKASVYIRPFDGEARIVFHAVRGNGYRGDIAIDNVILTPTTLRNSNGDL